MAAVKPKNDRILAYAKVIRLTDRLLSVAEELRDARKQLDLSAEAEECRPFPQPNSQDRAAAR